MSYIKKNVQTLKYLFYKDTMELNIIRWRIKESLLLYAGYDFYISMQLPMMSQLIYF